MKKASRLTTISLAVAALLAANGALMNEKTSPLLRGTANAAVRRHNSKHKVRSTRRTLTKSAYIYNGRGKRTSRRALPAGQKVKTYGAPVKRHGHLYWLIGKNRYVRTASFAKTQARVKRHKTSFTIRLTRSSRLVLGNGRYARKRALRKGTKLRVSGSRYIKGKLYYLVGKNQWIRANNARIQRPKKSTGSNSHHVSRPSRPHEPQQPSQPSQPSQPQQPSQPAQPSQPQQSTVEIDHEGTADNTPQVALTPSGHYVLINVTNDQPGTVKIADENDNEINETQVDGQATYVFDASQYAGQMVTGYGFNDDDEGTSSGSATVSDQADAPYSQNDISVPSGYTSDAVHQANSSNDPSLLSSESAEGREENTFHSESANDDTEIVDPNNLTSDQQEEINDFGTGLYNSIRNQAGLSGTVSTDDETQNLANDIASDYADDVRSGSYDFNQGHDVNAIVTAANADGLAINDNFVEDLYTTGNNADDDQANSITNLKEMVYDALTSFMFNGNEYAHASDLLKPDARTVAFSFNKINGWLAVHLIDVDQQTIDISADNGGTW